MKTRSASFSGENGVMAQPPPEMWTSGVGARIVSGLVLAAGAILALYAGVAAFAGLVALAAVVLAWEWTRLCGEGRFGKTGLVHAAAMLAVVIVAGAGFAGWALALIFASIVLVYALARQGARVHPAWIAVGPAYIGLPCVAMVWLRGDSLAGRELVLWLMLTVWATDTGAYAAGKLIGGPLLAPRVSPKKTWAGLFGAMASAALVGIVAQRFDPQAPAAVLLAGAGASIAIVAQAGDLGESWVKRRFGVKDSSHLIPGHGGLFDRLDGLMPAAALLALWQWMTGGDMLSWR